MTTWLHDVRYAGRGLRRAPGFATVAILTLALGIGANTAIFSVINPLLLRPLAFDAPEQLVWIANTGTGGLSGVTSRTSNLRDYRRLSTSFDAITGYFAFFDYGGYNLVGDGEPERLVGVGVAQDFLDVLGVQPLIGRNFVDEESVWNGRRAALLTYGFWERRFGADRGIVGQTLRLNDEPTTVVGVLPATFDFASTFSPGSRIDIVTPFPISDETDRQGNTLAMIGRLTPGASVESAQAELDVINQQLREEDPGRWGLGANVAGLQEHLTGTFRRSLLLLTFAVGVVMLIACVNLSNLLLARGAARRSEIAVRSSLGASRVRLLRQMLTESLVLSACGSVIGVGFAYGAVRLIASATAIPIPLLRSVGVDGSALLFAVGVAVAAAVLSGGVPALQLSKGGERLALSQSSRSSSGGRSQAWLRDALVVSEVALACVLLVASGLLLRSFSTLLDVDLGFQTDGAMTWRIESGRSFATGPERIAYHDRLIRLVGESPGVESVGLTDSLPLGRNRTWSVRVKGQVYAEGEQPGVFPRMVDAGYLQTMRIPLVSGRYITPDDTSDRDGVAVINEGMAGRLWPGGDPLEQVIQLGSTEWRVVGVVRDTRHGALEENAGNEMYFPIDQQPDFGSLDLVVRGALPPEVIVPQVQAALREADPSLPVLDFQRLGDVVERAVSPRRFILFLLGGFALSALLLVSLGIYGVLSYTVRQRRHEIGIRRALGESAVQVQRRVVARTLVLALMGILLGWIGSTALSGSIATLLYGVSPADPMTFGAMVGLLLLISGMAGYLPARRAARIDPMVALHGG